MRSSEVGSDLRSCWLKSRFDRFISDLDKYIYGLNFHYKTLICQSWHKVLQNGPILAFINDYLGNAFCDL